MTDLPATEAVLDDFYFVRRGYLNANHVVFADRNPVLVDTGYITDAPNTLADGQTIAIGPHRFKVIHTPGHAADGIVRRGYASCRFS